MAWLGEGGTFLFALVVLLVPGGAAALTVRLRGFAALAAAAPLSLAMLTAAALLNIVVPFRWSPGVWAIGAVLLIVAAFALRVLADRLIARGRIAPAAAGARPWREILPFVVVLGVGIFSAVRLSAVFAAPSNISQTFDNIYHLNAVREILDDGVIAPTRQLLPGFYPDLWHVVVSTVAELSGAGIPASVNVVSIVLGAFVWPISCVWLVRTIVGAHTGATIAAGALSIGLTSFPMLMLDFGVLYPNVLSISLLPSAIAATLLVAGVGQAEGRPDAVIRWALLVAIVPTMAVAHPSTLMAFLLPAMLIALTGLVRWWRRAERPSTSARAWALVLFVTGLAAATVLFIVARPTRELAYWPPSAGLADAVTQIVSGGLVWRPPSWIASVAVAAGILTIVIVPRLRQQWWLLVSTAGMVVLYLVCMSYPLGNARYLLTGTWYQDIYRIAALFPVYLVPLGALGVLGLVSLVSRAMRDTRSGRAAPVIVGTAAGVALLIVTQTGEAMGAQSTRTAAMYRQNAESPLLTNDERTLLSRLPEVVPADEVIVGSPWTGTSLSFALADRRSLVPHIFQELTPDMTVITERLKYAGEDAEVCAALERTRTRWVLDFGSAEIHGGDNGYPGLSDLGDVVRLADSQGEARLYEIVACD